MRYPVYSDYAVTRWIEVGSIPSGWEARRLKFAVTLRNEKIEAEDANLEYMGLEHIESWTGKRIEDEAASSEGVATRFVKDDVLFGKLRPYLAKVYLAEKEGMATTEALVLMTEPALIPIFLKYLLLSEKFINAVSGSTFGAKMPRANWEAIGGLPILLPSHNEQQQIAAFLDWKTGQIDELIAKKKELLEKLKEKRLAVITQAVTKGLNPAAPMRDSGIPWLGQVPQKWKVEKLKFSVSKIGSGITPKGGAESYEMDGIPLLRSQNVYFDGLRLDDVVFISEETDLEMANSRTSIGDVLLNITGASIGRCNFVDESLPKANVNQHVCIIRPVAKLLPKYLHYLMWSRAGQAQIDVEQSGSGREGLNFASLKNFVFPFPCIDEQLVIVNHLSQALLQLDTLLDRTESAIDRLTEYRTALITAATTGKIDVRNVAVPSPPAPPASRRGTS